MAKRGDPKKRAAARDTVVTSDDKYGGSSDVRNRMRVAGVYKPGRDAMAEADSSIRKMFSPLVKAEKWFKKGLTGK